MSDQYQLNERADHCTVSIGDSLYVWAGNQYGLPKVHDSDEKGKFTSNIQHFTPSTGQWITRYTTGTPPLGVMGYSCTAINDQLYYFGGACGHDACYHNSITQLDACSLHWREIEPTDALRPVMRRGWSGMISFEYDGVHHLLMIGGYGAKPATQMPHTEYNELPGGRWRTNEHSMYNLSLKKWSKPSIIGRSIPSADGFTIQKIDGNRAILFGGILTLTDQIDNTEETTCTTASSNIYLLEISVGTVFWQCVAKLEAIDQWPVGRYHHASAVIVTESGCPLLVISGGKDINEETLSDFWIFNITQHSWIKLDVPHSVGKKLSHSLSVLIMSPCCVWIITVGGEMEEDGFDDNNDVEDTDLLLDFVKFPNIVMLTELVANSEGPQDWTVGGILDTNGMNTEDYKKKYQQHLHLLRREWLDKRQKPEKLVNILALQTNQELMKILHEKEKDKQDIKRDCQQEIAKKEKEIKEQKERGEGEKQDMQIYIQEMEREKAEREQRFFNQLKDNEMVLQKQNIDLQKMSGDLKEKNAMLEEKNRYLDEKDKELQANRELLQVKDRELQEKVIELQNNQEALQEKDGELQQLQEAYHQQDSQWVITKDEIILTKEELGRGSYAVVKVGIFRGLKVAVKSLHTIVISDYNLALFSREMSIASRVRHPNLVQFIGATKVGNPLILTELMNTSLNHELQKNRLTNQQILSIAQDVALGLNYLHLFKPQPIIHRDVSSPNILLKPCTGPAGYEAKVADYGTAKLQQGTSAGTVMPGNPAYAAPEGPIPDQHSPAMDVYSYSVLLMEMNLHCPPEMTTLERARQSGTVSWSDMKSLVQRGLKSDPRNRLSMAQIIESLRRIKI